MGATLRIPLLLLADHVWQSTLFGGGVALLVLAFRRCRADVRFLLWLAASLKFAVPFAALIALGTSFGWTHAPLPQPTFRLAVDVAAQPFAPASADRGDSVGSPDPSTNPWRDPSVRGYVWPIAAAAWGVGAMLLLLRWSLQWRRVMRVVRQGIPLETGREVEILRALQRTTRSPQSVRICATDSSMEPGVVGILRPVLLWPVTLSARLDDQQIAAILAHELAHVRRRDNLSALLHMVVQAVFWFHPMVWWLSARLIDERERACDEDVLRRGNEPARYAESILRTCEFYLEAPLPCVTGVTGADLKRRIETIMRNRPFDRLGRARAILLSACAVAAFLIPIAVGVMRAPRLMAQTVVGASRFDAVSVRRNTSGDPGGFSRVQGNHYTATNITLRQLILNAYGILQSQLASGPTLATADFTTAEHFDIEATLADGASPAQFPEMLRGLLADRFKLSVHKDTREMPVYTLVKARSDGRLGPALKVTTEVCAERGREAGPGARGNDVARPPSPAAAVPPLPDGDKTSNRGMVVGGRQQGPGCGSLQFGPGQFVAHAVGIDMLVNALVNRGPITGIDRIVLDRTNLSDRYDFELKWTPPGRAGGPAPTTDDPDRPSLFTALQEQLGLKLEPQRAPIEVLVIDSAQMPAEN